MSEHYREAEEILSDEAFLSWYFKTGDGRDKDWLDWMSQHPESEELVRQAVEILNTSRLPERHVTAGQLKVAEERLMTEIEVLEVARRAGNGRGVVVGSGGDIGGTGGGVVIGGVGGAEGDGAGGVVKGKMRVVRLRVSKWAVAAAVVLVAASVWLLLGPLHASRPEVKTEFGQIVNQRLPDGTEVTMNANSLLRYTTGWKDGADREVWVNGEVFFHVRKTEKHSRFIVHSEHFDVIVTGTRFNVVNRHGRDNVLLEEGSVTIVTRDGHTVHMRPGDMMAYDSSMMARKVSRTDSVLAWKDQKLVLDHTPMKDLANIIHDHYGVLLQPADDSVGERLVSGILPNNNLEVLLQALEATGDFDIERKGDTISIKVHRP